MGGANVDEASLGAAGSDFLPSVDSNLDGGLFSNSAFPGIDSQFDQLMAPTAPPASLEAGALLPIHPPPLFLSRP